MQYGKHTMRSSKKFSQFNDYSSMGLLINDKNEKYITAKFPGVSSVLYIRNMNF